MIWLDRLIYLKKSTGKTTDEIAQISGVPKGTLNKLFAGQTKDPQLSTITAVVHSLGYTLDDLDEPKQPDSALSVSEEAHIKKIPCPGCPWERHGGHGIGKRI